MKKLTTMMIKDFKHWTKESYVLLIIGLITQIFLLLKSPLKASDFLATMGAISGIICVLMISNKKTSNAIFGILAGLIIIYNAWQHRIFADALLQIGYIIILDIPLLLTWTKHQNPSTGEVTDIKALQGLKDWSKYFGLAALGTVVFTFVLSTHFIGDTQPFVDALGFAIGITGGILCVKRNQSQFIFWALQGLISTVLWFRASLIAGTGFLSPLAIMYVFYLANDVVGYVNYGRCLKTKEVR